MQQSLKNQKNAQVDMWFVNYWSKKLKENVGSASVEFVLLAIPLFVPILLFLNQFATLSNAELVTRNLVRESLRAYVTSENPFIAASRANETLRTGAQLVGLNSEEINSLDLKFDCTKFPCLSPGGRIRATLTMRIADQNRIVKAEAEEFISPWQWNGLGLPAVPHIGIDL